MSEFQFFVGEKKAGSATGLTGGNNEFFICEGVKENDTINDSQFLIEESKVLSVWKSFLYRYGLLTFLALSTLASCRSDISQNPAENYPLIKQKDGVEVKQSELLDLNKNDIEFRETIDSLKKELFKVMEHKESYLEKEAKKKDNPRKVGKFIKTSDF